MENTLFKDLTITELNKLFGLSPNNDLSIYIERHDNGVPLMDRNYYYTAYLRNSKISYVIEISSAALSKIEKKEYDSHVLRLFEPKEKYYPQEKLRKVKTIFNSKVIKYFKIVTTNVFIDYSEDEKAELHEEWDKQIDKNQNDMYDDIPYLGLPEEEQETGHWNID